MMLRQLLKLVLLLFVTNLPSCWSVCDISAARRAAHLGAASKFSHGADVPKIIANKGAKKAKVKLVDVEEAYSMDGQPPTTCLLFKAWSKDCISHLMYCVASASSIKRRDIDVLCVPVYLMEMSVKSGGRVYLKRDSNTPVVSDAANLPHAGKKLMIVACRLWHNVTSDIRDSKEKYCVSIIDPARPAWSLRHYNYYLHLEPEYSPRNPHIFDQDASFLLIPDKFWPGFCALESINYRNHYIQATDDGRMKISVYKDTKEFRNSASFTMNSHFIKHNHPCSSCKEIHDLMYTDAPSGEYSIKTSSGLLMEKVYCEMGLNGGGYTFINPQYLTILTNDEVQAMFTDKTSFLMRVRRADLTQPYGVLKQLPDYKNVPLKLGLNEYSEYTMPQNLNKLGPNFLYFGFIPASKARNRNKQGLQINGYNRTFTNRDANPNSYMVLFPNFHERTPTDYIKQSTFDFCDDMSSALTLNPSCRVMPADYFMFYETHWGGYGCYTQTDGRQSIGATLNVAIGFR